MLTELQCSKSDGVKTDLTADEISETWCAWDVLQAAPNTEKRTLGALSPLVRSLMPDYYLKLADAPVPPTWTELANARLKIMDLTGLVIGTSEWFAVVRELWAVGA